MPSRRNEGRSCQLSGQDRVESSGRSVDEDLDPAEEFRDVLRPFACREFDRSHRASDGISRGRRRLEQSKSALVGLDDKIRERAAGVDGEPHRRTDSASPRLFLSSATEAAAFRIAVRVSCRSSVECATET